MPNLEGSAASFGVLGPLWVQASKAFAAKKSAVTTTVGMRKGDFPDEEESGMGAVVTGIAPERTSMRAAKASMEIALACEP